MIILLRQHSINIKNFFSNTEDKSLNWLKIFVIVFIILTFIDIFLYNKIPENIYCLIIIAFIGFLGYFSIKQTEIYTKNLSSENLSDFSTPHIKKMINVPSLTNHLGTAIEEQTNNIIKKIFELLEKDKIFCNSKFTLEDFSKRLIIHKNHLSFIINNKLNKNFFQLVNEYRIKEAQRLLIDSKYDNLSIEGIAKTVGFNSKSVFNPIFKKYTEVTPSEYRNKR